uniref:Ig-like domain-containing protein n=1 Tax=Hucho hucho TaxID=62062 RepID=A0A4W5KGV6_9TELE
MPLEFKERFEAHLNADSKSVPLIIKRGSNVLLSCNYSSAYSLLWYKQSPGSAPQYLLLILDSTRPGDRAVSLDSHFSGKLNKEKTRVDLEISSVEVTDSALYYCALRPTVTGNLETLYKNLTSPESVFNLCSSRFHLTIVSSSGVNMNSFYLAIILLYSVLFLCSLFITIRYYQYQVVIHFETPSVAILYVVYIASVMHVFHFYRYKC